MGWQAIAMYAVVAGIGVPAAFRNVTALAMVIAWLLVELAYQITGDSLPLRFSIMADIAVIASIYAKTIHRVGTKTYPTVKEQLRCLVVDLTRWDRGIVAIFLLGAWPAYALSIDPFWKWYLLWGLCIAQFLLAGGEALASFLKAKREAKNLPPLIDRHLKVIPFPVKRRRAEAVRKPSCMDDLLIVKARAHVG